MNKINENKKLKVMELQNNYTPVSQYAYTKEIEEKLTVKRKKREMRAVNKIHVIMALFYITVFILATMTKMLIVYEITNLGLKKIEIERKLNEVKVEVETLENTYISNYDLKKVEEKAKELGFIPNDNMKFINMNK